MIFDYQWRKVWFNQAYEITVLGVARINLSSPLPFSPPSFPGVSGKAPTEGIG